MVKGKLKIILGAVVLFSLIGVIIASIKFKETQVSKVTLNGMEGGEMIAFLENEKVRKIVEKKYGISYGIKKQGSIDMVQKGAYDNFNYLFPSSQFAAYLFRYEGGSSKTKEIVFNTPIVLLTRKPVADALEKNGFLSVADGVYYVDMQKLAEAIRKGASWKSLGLDQLYGDLLVDSTDPNSSNSGNMFLALLANALNGNKPVTEDSVSKISSDLKSIYDKMGYSQSSSADLFNQFMQQGMGAHPIIAAYENQLLEFSLTNSSAYEQLKGDLVIMYPTPTVWSSHVFIGLNDDSVRMQEILLDKEVQDIAWKEHGFRTVVSGLENLNETKVSGIAKQVSSIMPLPKPEIMMRLMEAVK